MTYFIMFMAAMHLAAGPTGPLANAVSHAAQA